MDDVTSTCVITIIFGVTCYVLCKHILGLENERQFGGPGVLGAFDCTSNFSSHSALLLRGSAKSCSALTSAVRIEFLL